MNSRRTTIERAYDLAETGNCAGVMEIKARLKAEGYRNVDAELYGSTVTKALRGLCVAAARKKEQAPGG